MSQDRRFVELISETIKNLGDNPSREVCWDAFVEAEQDLIKESYSKGTNLNQFKGDWKKRFHEVLCSLKYNKKKVTGEKDNWQLLIAEAIKASRVANSSSSTATTSTPTTSTSSKHNRSVKDLDKAPLIAYLSDLPLDKKWKLNCSGRYVEDIMVEAINHCAFDHPCLSFILDLADPMWRKLLNEEEIREINSYKRPQMPSVSEDIQSYHQRG